MNKTIGFALLSMAVTSMNANALMIDITFDRITGNNSENVANQLSAQLRDHSSALADFNISLATDEVLFTFQNSANVPSSISEIYFDDGVIFSQTSLYNSLSGFTDFSGGTPTPANLPAGNTTSPNFVATAGFGADFNGNPNKGIDQNIDITGIKIKLLVGLNSNDVVTALNNGNLRLGLHVKSIGNAGGSDSFINAPASLPATPVPLPAAVWLFGGALATLLGNSRRKKSSLSSS